MAAATSQQIVSDRKWHHLYPELGTGPVPIAPYTSPEYYEREQALIFRKVWLNVARVEQIPRPGDYLVKELEVCNTSILIVRGKDGIIRAFHNMCTHRGNKLAPDASGNCAGLFTCKFHGWAFGLGPAVWLRPRRCRRGSRWRPSRFFAVLRARCCRGRQRRRRRARA